MHNTQKCRALFRSTRDHKVLCSVVVSSIAGAITQCDLRLPQDEGIEGFRVSSIKDFSILPVTISLTPFQRAVHEVVKAIPCGCQLTYGGIAQLVGSPYAYRAVAQVLAHNPVPLLVPCHRVVAKNGVGGYMGEREGRWVTFKMELLQREQLGEIFEVVWYTVPPQNS